MHYFPPSHYVLQMSAAEAEQLMENLGIPRTDTGGFPYTDVIPYLAKAIESTKSEN